MLTQALDSIGAPLSPPPDDILEMIAADLMATLGWTGEQARSVVSSVGSVDGPDPEQLAMQAAEEVQQWLHDSFLDTSWPRCPRHPNHPLWLGEDSPFMWHCPTTGAAVATLGHLDAVIAAPSEEEAALAQVQLEKEQGMTLATLARFVPALRRRLGR